MTAIRPDLSSLAPRPAATPSGAPDARNAAQAAFFRLALGQAAAPTAIPPVQSPPTAQTIIPARAADPERPLRPGSLLDIRV